MNRDFLESLMELRSQVKRDKDHSEMQAGMPQSACHECGRDSGNFIALAHERKQYLKELDDLLNRYWEMHNN